MPDPLPDTPPAVSTRALLIHLLGRLDAIEALVTPPPPPRWYIRMFFWILDWRSTIIAGVAMIPWRGKQP